MGFFFLALATKEEAAALPLILILLDYFFVSGQRVAALKGRVWLHACFVAVVPLGLVARRLVTGAWLPPQVIDPGLYLLTQAAAFPLYFFRAVIPLDPALYRGHLPATWPPGGTTVAFLFLAAVIAVIAAVRRRERPEWSFAVACLVAGLLPSSSIVSLNEMVVDHRAYLGSIGVAFALGLLLWRLGGFRLGLLVLVVLSARSVSYQWVLGDPVRAWEDAVARAPNAPDALCALGESYAERGDPRAEALFLQATRLDPSNYRYWANLGVLYGDLGRLPQAVDALRLALQRKPEASVHDYRGQLLLRLGRDDEAATEFEARDLRRADFRHRLRESRGAPAQARGRARGAPAHRRRRPVRKRRRRSRRLRPSAGQAPVSKVRAVTAIVLNYNGHGFVTESVKSLLDQEFRDLEVVVVDNASTDGSAEEIEATFGGRVRLVRAPRNLGFGAGNNLAIREARGRHIVLLNNDAVATPAFVAEMVKAAEG
jgi:hypothetical protein